MMPVTTRRTRLTLLACAVAVFLASGCTTTYEREAAPYSVEGAEYTVWNDVWNVISFPFRLVGALVVYPLKFLFYDLWVWLYEVIVPADPYLDTVLPALSGAEPHQRIMGARLAREVRDPRALPTLAEYVVTDLDPAVRAECLLAIGDLGSPEWIISVRPGLSDPDPSVVGAAILASGQIGGPGEADRLAAMWEQQGISPWIRLNLMSALAELRDGRLRGAWWTIADDAKADPLHRATALWALGVTLPADGRAAELTRLAAYLSSDDPRFVNAAASGLGRAGLAGELTSRLPAATNACKVEMLKAIGEFGAAADAQAVIAVRGTTDDAAVAGYGAIALSRLAVPGGFRECVALLNTPMFALRTTAWMELRRRSGQQIPLDHGLWKAWLDANGEPAAVAVPAP